MEPPATESSSIRYTVGSTVVPGDRLANLRQDVFTPGIGTYTKAGHVYASRLGRLELIHAASDDSEKTKPLLTVVSPVPLPRELALRQGQVVIARVLRLTTQQVYVEILAASGDDRESKAGSGADTSKLRPFSRPYEGTIRIEDIRAGTTEPNVADCFMPGDLILARVLSLGDAPRRPYTLTTTETELGVVYAKSADGEQMYPVSEKEMKTESSGQVVKRKVARPIPEAIVEAVQSPA